MQKKTFSHRKNPMIWIGSEVYVGNTRPPLTWAFAQDTLVCKCACAQRVVTHNMRVVEWVRLR